MAGLGLDFFGSLLSGGDIGESLINNISGGDPSQIFGSKPEVAPYTPIDLNAETAKAVSSNLSNLPSITDLLNKTIPGFSDLLSTNSATALSLSRGELPQADVDALQRSSAFKALQGGYGGTPMGKALTLRDLGIGTLQGQVQGANLAQQMTQLAEGAYSPFITTPGQQAGTTAANNAGLQAQKQFQFNVNAAPNPSALGHFQLDQHIGDQFMSFGLGAAGGAIAGGGSSVPAYGGNSNSLGGSYAASPPPYYGAGTFNAAGTSPSYQQLPAWYGAYGAGG